MYNLHTSEEKDVSELHCKVNVLGDSPRRQAFPLSTSALVCSVCSEEQLCTLVLAEEPLYHTRFFIFNTDSSLAGDGKRFFFMRTPD